MSQAGLARRLSRVTAGLLVAAGNHIRELSLGRNAFQIFSKVVEIFGSQYNSFIGLSLLFARGDSTMTGQTGRTEPCVVFVGTTGTGKSSLVSLLSGQEVASSAGRTECTTRIQAVRGGGKVWLDTVGWDGTDATRSDLAAFHLVLRHLQVQSSVTVVS